MSGQRIDHRRGLLLVFLLILWSFGGEVGCGGCIVKLAGST
jgi:hypothetical protein